MIFRKKGEFLSSNVTIYTYTWKGDTIKATIADLRYKMRDILKALERKEKVTIMYHGKQKGVIVPSSAAKDTRVSKHPFFGMLPQDTEVHEVMAGLRGGRYRAV